MKLGIISKNVDMDRLMNPVAKAAKIAGKAGQRLDELRLGGGREVGGGEGKWGGG